MNYYKYTLVFLLICTSYFSFGQNNIYMITEQYTSNQDFSSDKVYVTDPAGVVTTYTIPHFFTDPSNHDSQFNLILNGITSQGYKITSVSNWHHGDSDAGFNSKFTRTIFLGQP